MMTFLTSRYFWGDLLERAISSGAGGALAIATAASFGLFRIDSWRDLAGAAGLAALVSVLKAFSLQRTGTTPSPAAEVAPPASSSTTSAAPLAPTVVAGGGVTSVYPAGQ